MFRGFVWGILIAIVVALTGGYLVLRNGLIPANADASPGWFETWAADTSLNATLDREPPKAQSRRAKRRQSDRRHRALS